MSNEQCRLKKYLKKQAKSGFVTVPEFVTTHLIEVNGVKFHRKPILIEKAISQLTQSLKFNPRLRNAQNSPNLPLLKRRNKTPTTINQMLLNEERKTSCFSTTASLEI